MIVLNEEKEAQKILNNNSGFIKLGDLVLLAKYFNKHDYPIKDSLKKYINDRTDQYNQVVYDDYIEKAMEQTETFKLRDNNKVHITQNELDTILSIEDFKVQRVAFTMLMVSRYYRVNPSRIIQDDIPDDINLFFKNSISDLFKLSKVTYSVSENMRITRELKVLGLVDWYAGGSAEILFEDKVGKPIKYFTPNESMVYYLYQFHNCRVVECERCGTWIKLSKKANNTKYCQDCSIQIDREKAVARMRKLRKNNDK